LTFSGSGRGCFRVRGGGVFKKKARKGKRRKKNSKGGVLKKTKKLKTLNISVFSFL
jgi:hypothetical protein